MADKWSYERLFAEWDNLVKVSKSLGEFHPKRDALVQESGWTKLEFYKEMDRRAFTSYRGDVR